MSEESELHEGSVNGSDVNEGSSTAADLGRPETEEEKRKNFLERNRQGALFSTVSGRFFHKLSVTDVRSALVLSVQLLSSVDSARRPG